MLEMKIDTGQSEGLAFVGIMPPLTDSQEKLIRGVFAEKVELVQIETQATEQGKEYTQLIFDVGDVERKRSAISEISAEIASLLRCGGEVCVSLLNEGDKQLDQGEVLFKSI